MSNLKKFSVLVKVEVERAVMVEATDRHQAEELATEALTYDFGSAVVMIPHDTQEVDAEVRVETYTCLHCEEPSPKVAWGPGRIRCPRCNKIAPTVEEQRAETFARALIPG